MSSSGSSAAPAAAPRLQFTLRSRNGVQTFWGPREVAKIDTIGRYVVIQTLLQAGSAINLNVVRLPAYLSIARMAQSWLW